ncbi:MAG: hypothetical protein GY816_09620 [Cytophagales bacterium]|nr:hypothetical protein [Cytophagales bacterium]
MGKLTSLTLQEKQRPLHKDAQGWLYEIAGFVNSIQYKEHKLNWLEYQKGYLDQPYQERFTHLSSMLVSDENIWQMSKSGRLRWKIENEGFNTQKNQGYGLQHKFSQTSGGDAELLPTATDSTYDQPINREITKG